MLPSCTPMDCLTHSSLRNIPFRQHDFVSEYVLLRISLTIGNGDLKNTTLNKTVIFPSHKRSVEVGSWAEMVALKISGT